MPNGFSNLHANHRVLTGGVLVGVGLFGLYGSFTGTLAPMLAALFDPGALRAVKGPSTLLGPAKTNAKNTTGGKASTGKSELTPGTGAVTGTPFPEVNPGIPTLPPGSPAILPGVPSLPPLA